MHLFALKLIEVMDVGGFGYGEELGFCKEVVHGIVRYVLMGYDSWIV